MPSSSLARSIDAARERDPAPAGPALIPPGAAEPAAARDGTVGAAVRREAALARAVVTYDPRWLQLAFLASFFGFGLAARDFPVWHAPLIFGACLATQWLCSRALRVAGNGWLSPAITASGLTLLLRSDLLWPFLLAAIVAIATKFLIRVRGRHFLNPANAGLCAALLATPHAWCSPTQWGESAALLLWMATLGLAVAHRAFRGDASLAFLGAFVALKAGRVLWLGQETSVLTHQLQSGSLLLFTFFMISDPKTTPKARRPRIAFGVTVACVAFAMQLHFINNAVVWALLACAPVTPLFDALESVPCGKSFSP